MKKKILTQKLKLFLNTIYKYASTKLYNYIIYDKIARYGSIDAPAHVLSDMCVNVPAMDQWHFLLLLEYLLRTFYTYYRVLAINCNGNTVSWKRPVALSHKTTFMGL